MLTAWDLFLGGAKCNLLGAQNSIACAELCGICSHISLKGVILLITFIPASYLSII